MKLMLQSLPAEIRFWRVDRRAASATAWRLEKGALVPEPRLVVARPTVLIPSEEVLLLAVELPLPSHRRRVELLPFAIEDSIAHPPGDAHLVLGPALLGKRYLAAVVSHETMQRWLALLAVEGLDQAALVPDALAVPWGGEGWSVELRNDRALVRSADGAGMALPLASLPLAWAAAGKPKCRVAGGTVPAYLELEDAGEPLPLAPGPLLDLRTGPYARRRAAAPRALKRLGWIAAGGLVAHATIAAADTYALMSLADRREQETRALLATIAPGRPVGDDVIDVATALLPAGDAAGSPGGFLPLLTRVAAVSGAAGTAWQALRFDDRGGSLAIDVEAQGIETLEATRNALAAAGLRTQLDGVDVGAAGGMRGRLQIMTGEVAP